MGSNPAGRAKIQDLAAKTKSFQLLWDGCGTFYPQVLADATQFKDLAGKTRSSCPAVGLCGTSRAHVRAGRWRRVTAFVCHFGREADSPASAGDQHRHSRNDRPSNDWHGRAVLRDPLRKRRLRANDTRTNDEDRGRKPTDSFGFVQSSTGTTVVGAERLWCNEVPAIRRVSFPGQRRPSVPGYVALTSRALD